MKSYPDTIHEDINEFNIPSSVIGKSVVMALESIQIQKVDLNNSIDAKPESEISWEDKKCDKDNKLPS